MGQRIQLSLFCRNRHSDGNSNEKRRLPHQFLSLFSSDSPRLLSAFNVWDQQSQSGSIAAGFCLGRERGRCSLGDVAHAPGGSKLTATKRREQSLHVFNRTTKKNIQVSFATTQRELQENGLSQFKNL